jgi:vacuolar-type H+-ATPase subunit C/Vma6
MLSQAFDIAHLLPIHDQIHIYVEMHLFDEIRDFAKAPLLELQNKLINSMDFDSLNLMKNLLYNIGIDFNYKKLKTFYTDSHNVHSLAKSTDAIAKSIIKECPNSYNRPSELADSVFDHFFEAIESLEYHAFDPKKLFASVFKCIIDSNNIEILNRLKEELIETEGLCLTGCITRLVNSIRGFGFDKFETKINDYEYEKSKYFFLEFKFVLSRFHFIISITNNDRLNPLY